LQLLGGELDADEIGDSDEVTDEEQSFALEAHLRDFLANNLHVIEPGLRLFQDAGKRGVEFPIDGGRIDLLATDSKGVPVVIELKLLRVRNQALGQLLYYMGWVDENLGKGKCRRIIVAADIPDALAVAVLRVPGVSLYRYKLSLTTEPVGRAGG
jgi:RecB family endonuclease NucS